VALAITGSDLQSPRRPAPFVGYGDAVAGYEGTRARHVEHMLELLPGHLERLRWSSERLSEERTRRLRELVTVAKERSPWHRERLADVDERTLDEDTLGELPTMEKAQLMENFDRIVTDRRVTLAAANGHIAGLRDDAYFLGDLHAVASGGSSGVRGVFVWDWEGWTAVRLVALRQQIADRLSDPELAAKQPVGMIVAANNATHFTTASAETFATDAVPVHRIPIGWPLARIVTALNEVDGDGLATYPSMLSSLVGEARAGRLRIRPRRILTMAEPLFDDIREGAEGTWEAPVANMWGTSEAGIVGIGCFVEPGMHLADDQVIVEPVDGDGRPVPPGVPSQKVFVTNLEHAPAPHPLRDHRPGCDVGPSLWLRVGASPCRRHSGSPGRRIRLQLWRARAPARVPLGARARIGGTRVSGPPDRRRRRDPAPPRRAHQKRRRRGKRGGRAEQGRVGAASRDHPRGRLDTASRQRQGSTVHPDAVNRVIRPLPVGAQRRIVNSGCALAVLDPAELVAVAVKR
jgi:phenylacetate-coenzyme A ligase PaaK-like adenylate-forming protein